MSITKLKQGFLAIAVLCAVGLVGCGEPKDAATAYMEKQASQPVAKAPDTTASLQVDPRGFVPGPAPEVTFKTIDGKKVKLSDYKGKVVLIDLWATWCGPCKLGLPFTNRMSQELKDRGLQVLAISDEPAHVVKAFVKEYKYGFEAFTDEDDAVTNAMMTSGFPTTVIIDRKGNIVAKEVGLAPQTETIAGLQKAGLDVSGFEPKDDPTKA